jgi:hypothetical protein
MSPTTFIAAFLPVLVCVGWILLASQPGNGWGEGRVDSWSSSIGILGIVHSVGLWRGVLAFGFGAMLALSLDSVPAPEPVDTVVTEEPAVADEPVAAERSSDFGGRHEEPVSDEETVQTTRR